MSGPVRLSIDIWSDVMCPWCIIGYKHLEAALVCLEGEVEAEIRWRPFELNRDMPAQGEDLERHMRRKYGIGPSEGSGAGERMAAIAERAGYAMRYLGEGEAPPRRLWNTFLAHKLLHWTLAAHGPRSQTRLKLALFDAHFQQRWNVSDPVVLTDIAVATGLDRAEVEQALADAALAEVLRAEEAEAFDLGITAVPMIIVERKYMMPGAQEPQAYVELLRKVVARQGQ